MLVDVTWNYAHPQVKICKYYYFLEQFSRVPQIIFDTACPVTVIKTGFVC